MAHRATSRSDHPPNEMGNFELKAASQKHNSACRAPSNDDAVTWARLPQPAPRGTALPPTEPREGRWNVHLGKSGESPARSRRRNPEYLRFTKPRLIRKAKRGWEGKSEDRSLGA